MIGSKLYVDTSAIVKLYVNEDHSLEVADWLKRNNEAIPWSGFHSLEFTNAIHLKEFRREITPDESQHIKARFSEHEERGVYYRPELDWAETFGLAVDLSARYTIETGTRALDILHVAAALTLKADRFLTFDERQSKIADLELMAIVQTS